MSQDQSKQTPLHSIHVSLGAKLVPFAGFEMPVQYVDGITAEHKAVREGVGIFDVSHMGEFEITGPDRNAFANRITCNDVGVLESGQAQYSALLNEEGTFIDDCLVYRFDDRIMLVVNASNIEKDWEHVVGRKGGVNVRLRNISDEVGLLAVQGAKAVGVLEALTSLSLEPLPYYHHLQGQIAGVQCFISRTGYTGEDGFELYCRAPDTEALWNAITSAGPVVPCGLGARDTLRLEAGLPLYGNDIDDTINPYEARLGWIVKLDKGCDFTGRDALLGLKERGPLRRFVGFTLLERAFPRPGYPVHAERGEVDVVRSGTVSPVLGKPIGTTYLPTHLAKPDYEFTVDCRGKMVPAKVVKLPFVPHRVKR